MRQQNHLRLLLMTLILARLGSTGHRGVLGKSYLALYERLGTILLIFAGTLEPQSLSWVQTYLPLYNYHGNYFNG